MVVIWRSRKKQAVSSTLHSFFPDANHAGTSYFCQVPPATVLSTAEARSVTHTHTHGFMLLDHFWWSLNIFDDWNGFSCSGWLRACQAQQELLNVVALVNLVKVWSPLKFNEGWGDRLSILLGLGCRPGRWEGDSREDRIFPKGKPGFEIRQLGDQPQIWRMGCMHRLQQRNQNEFKESVFFQCSCHTSGLVTGDRANQTSHGICGDDARALSTAQGGRWMIVLQCSLTQNSCSNVEGMALQPRLVIQSQKELIISTTKEVWSVCGVT